MALRIKKNDMVYVLSGKDRGRTGRVLMVMPDEDKALVEGINLVSKHERRRSQTQHGGIVSKEAPIPLCKLMLVDQKGNGKPSRVRMEERDGKKVRVIVKTGNEV
ncbi:MAG TPA: 50S ribosomal protein L24 [Candidatus Sumerlaeota bacterium]|nr:50S ribosomal protein L24 [Candidatus Sumerlaeota bacterium]HPR99934.1 50S ribosomal protein L24 [Candidatus Sumerlaeota bacterium]